jgi:hypothetical protein
LHFEYRMRTPGKQENGYCDKQSDALMWRHDTHSLTACMRPWSVNQSIRGNGNLLLLFRFAIAARHPALLFSRQT